MSFELPWYRWCPKDYLADGDTIPMSIEEDCLYRRLLDMSWMEDGLPLDEKEICALSRFPPEVFQRCWPRVKRCFSDASGKLRNPRIERERNKSITSRNQHATAGALGGKVSGLKRRKGKNHAKPRLSGAEAPLKHSASGSVYGSGSSFVGKEGVQGEGDNRLPPLRMSAYQETLFLSVADDYPIQENIAGARAEWAAICPPPDQVLAAAMKRAISEQKICGCLDSRHDMKPHLKAWIRDKRWNDKPKEAPHEPSRVAGREVPGAEADRHRFEELDRVRREQAEQALAARKTAPGKHGPLPPVRVPHDPVHQPHAGVPAPGVRGPA